MPSADFKCVFCHADVVATTTRLIATIEIDTTIMVFTDVPCEKCVHCG